MVDLSEMVAMRHSLVVIGTLSVIVSAEASIGGRWWLSSSSSSSSSYKPMVLKRARVDDLHDVLGQRRQQQQLQMGILSPFGVMTETFLDSFDNIRRLEKRRRLVSSLAASLYLRGGDDVDRNKNEENDYDDKLGNYHDVDVDDDDNNAVDVATDHDFAQQASDLHIDEEDNKPMHKAKVMNNDHHDDDERYSRQLYTLGARAHRLVRSATVILDGPLGGRVSQQIDEDGEIVEIFRSKIPSGTLYEIAKNLALSGIGRIVLVKDNDDDDTSVDNNYFDGSLDDLGAAYRHAALAEIGGVDHENLNENDDDMGVSNARLFGDGALLLAEYIRRLNPGVQVDVISRMILMNTLCGNIKNPEIDEDDDEQDDDVAVSFGSKPIVICIDRSTTLQLKVNDACREASHVVPFISVETAGVHAKIFCDFGPKFVVVDEDGETPRSTLLHCIVDESSTVGDVGENVDRLYVVKCLEGERHDVSKDDIIEFHGDQSDDRGTKVLFPKCQVTLVKSPTCFIVKCLANRDTESESISDSSSSVMASLLEGHARSFARMKLPKQIAFSSLREILRPNDIDGSHRWNDETFFAPSDLDKSFDPIRRRAVMSAMLALDEFVKKYGQLPSHLRRRTNDDKRRTDSERLQSFVHRITKIDDESAANVHKFESLVTQFAQTCRAKLVPVQAVAGALGAQEALKVATGLYNPIRQFLLYDCDEVLQSAEEEEIGEGEVGSDSVAAPGLAYILGEAMSNKLARSRLFVVGAGAIGCELSKNLAAMGAGTGIGSTRRGSIILTDMDTIEKSNLSRQLLFRDHDVGEFKSVAARAAVMRFNHKVHVEAYTNRVGDDERFNDDFWSSGCHAVMNALDNVESRLFVDHKCVTHGLALIDAGTLGPKGNVQVVIPQKSESYGSSADPPEPDIPVCTLKNFPYDISHTIQWARDLFDGYFNRRPRQANDHVGEMPQIDDLHALARSMVDKLGDDAAIAMAEELGEDLGPFPFIVGADSHDSEYVAVVRKLSLDWAMKQANVLFYVTMAELIQKHPLDSVDDDDSLFWSGTRRAPKPMRFMPLDSDVQVSAQQVIINERIAQFVSSAARLRMESFLQKSSATSVTLEEALYALQEEAKILEKKKKKVETVLHNLSGGGSGRDRDTLSLILERLNAAKIGTSFQPYLFPADFEKDDECNGHVAFITAASNLRAMAYGIPPADAMETRRVAGKIVPAMITTTGLVSALSCIELVKLLRGLSLTKHRNAFVNLALPFFAFTAPMPADEVLGVNGKKHTLWDRLVCHGELSMTLEMFLEKILEISDCTDNFEVSSITYGPYMIFANFLHSQDKELLNTPLLNLVKDAIISEVDDNLDESNADESREKIIHLSVEQKAMLSRLDQKRFIDFSVAVENTETGEEFELPNVRLIKENLRQEVLTQEGMDNVIEPF